MEEVNVLKTTTGLNEWIAELVNLKRGIAGHLFKIGEILKKVRDDELYIEQCETFNEFLALPELSFSRSTAYKAITVWETFGSQMDNVLDIETDKLYLISGEVKDNPEKAEELIEQARSLSRSDLREERGRTVKKVTLEERIDAFLDSIQPVEFIPDLRRIDDWTKSFKSLIKEWEAYKK